MKDTPILIYRYNVIPVKAQRSLLVFFKANSKIYMKMQKTEIV